MTPPFRADHVGSLLRPARLVAARSRRRAGAITHEELRTAEDEAIREVIARQEALGLQSVTDGELRRDWWHLDFLRQLDGVEMRASAGPQFSGTDEQPPIAVVTGRVGLSRPIEVENFRYLKVNTRHTAKLTIPSPSMLHLRGGRSAIDAQVYPDLDAFWADVAGAYRGAIAHLAAEGLTYLQLDDVAFSYLCDEKVRAACRKNGDDPDRLPARYAATINAALKDRPAGLSVTLHTCRGNFKSAWVASGGYEAVAEALFSIEVDGFFMEFDSDRAGSFEPLRYLGPNQRVVLGLVTTKVGTIESKDELKRRIEAASRFVPLDRLCLSPQCGFSSTHHGNRLSQDEQWKKLALVVELADEVWGGAKA